MPSKLQIIKEMAAQEALSITSNTERYMAFLHTAANNYKYDFQEQLLIHAQKPDATACAEIDTWNKLGRWVNKGTKGIALLIDRDVPYKLLPRRFTGIRFLSGCRYNSSLLGLSEGLCNRLPFYVLPFLLYWLFQRYRKNKVRNASGTLRCVHNKSSIRSSYATNR